MNLFKTKTTKRDSKSKRVYNVYGDRKKRTKPETKNNPKTT